MYIFVNRGAVKIFIIDIEEKTSKLECTNPIYAIIRIEYNSNFLYAILSISVSSFGGIEKEKRLYSKSYSFDQKLKINKV